MNLLRSTVIINNQVELPSVLRRCQTSTSSIQY